MENLKKNIIIIGGGPGGMEAASCLNTIGYTVFLVEKGPVLGGHLAKWDRLFPEGNEAAPLIEKMRSRMEGVKWFVNTEVLSVNRLGPKYTVILSNGLTINADALLIATGFSLFPAEKKEEYGYGIYDRVITSADLERMFREGMPEGLVPKKIGFVHWVRESRRRETDTVPKYAVPPLSSRPAKSRQCSLMRTYSVFIWT